MTMGLKQYRWLGFFGLITFLSGCISSKPVQPPLELTSLQLTTLVSAMVAEQQKPSSFLAKGRLTIRNWYGDGEAKILAIGTRHPLRLKIEIDQTWGKPILHLFIYQDRLEIVSFPDQVYGIGTFHPCTLSRFLGIELSPDLIWATLRGYPPILEHDRALLKPPYFIQLLNAERTALEQITVNSETLNPEEVFFPASQLRIQFSDFKENNQIRFAGKIGIDSIGKKKDLALTYEDVLFNQDIPSQIFSISKPPQFKTINLDEQLFESAE